MIFGIFALLAILSGCCLSSSRSARCCSAIGSLPATTAACFPTAGSTPTAAIRSTRSKLRGTFTLCLIFLGVFVAVYVLNWYLLTQLWAIGA